MYGPGEMDLLSNKWLKFLYKDTIIISLHEQYIELNHINNRYNLVNLSGIYKNT